MLSIASRLIGRPAVSRFATAAPARAASSRREERARRAAAREETDGQDRLKLYTRTGDKGTSMLFNGERRGKDDLVFAALGDVDELNASLGLSREHCLHSRAADPLVVMLTEVQSRLMDVGAHVATPMDTSRDGVVQRMRFSQEHVDDVEKWIDEIEEELPPLRNFILPSGGLASASLHVARTVCRRAERTLTPLVHAGAVDDVVGRYINRMSDFCFAAARLAALRDGKEETLFVKSTKS